MQKWALWLGRIRFILKLLKENINCAKVTLKKILPFTNFVGFFICLVEIRVLFFDFVLFFKSSVSTSWFNFLQCKSSWDVDLNSNTLLLLFCLTKIWGITAHGEGWNQILVSYNSVYPENKDSVSMRKSLKCNK